MCYDAALARSRHVALTQARLFKMSNTVIWYLGREEHEPCELWKHKNTMMYRLAAAPRSPSNTEAAALFIRANTAPLSPPVFILLHQHLLLGKSLHILHVRFHMHVHVHKKRKVAPFVFFFSLVKKSFHIHDWRNKKSPPWFLLLMPKSLCEIVKAFNLSPRRLRRRHSVREEVSHRNAEITNPGENVKWTSFRGEERTVQHQSPVVRLSGKHGGRDNFIYPRQYLDSLVKDCKWPDNIQQVTVKSLQSESASSEMFSLWLLYFLSIKRWNCRQLSESLPSFCQQTAEKLWGDKVGGANKNSLSSYWFRNSNIFMLHWLMDEVTPSLHLWLFSHFSSSL